MENELMLTKRKLGSQKNMTSISNESMAENSIDTKRLETLLREGFELKTSLKSDGSSLTRCYFEDEDKYTSWKYRTIRTIQFLFPNDADIECLKQKFESFDKGYREHESFSQILGLIDAYINIPKIVVNPIVSAAQSFNINNNMSQSQSQSLHFVIESIKDLLTGEQIKQLKEILNSDVSEATKKESIFERIKSFGSDVAANILANIITSQNFIAHLF